MPQQRNSPITCVICRTTVLVTLQSAAKQQTCSITCRGLARRGKFFGQRATANRVCHVCDRPFHAKQVHIDAGIARFCSNRCRGASMQRPLIIPLATEHIIYMAGIVDGEGTITALRTTNPSTGTSGMALRVLVPNSSVKLMDWILATFGGSLSKPGKTRSVKHKPIIQWWVSAQQAVALCRILLPYLIVKRRQAELVIELSQLKYEYNSRGRWVPPATLAARQPLLDELRAVNYRGVAPVDAVPNGDAAALDS